MTMIEAFLKYMSNELGLSALTVEAYGRDLRQWEEYATSGGRYELRPESTSVSDLRLWLASLSREGASARTVRRKVQALRAFFRYMMRVHGMSDNPAAELVIPGLCPSGRDYGHDRRDGEHSGVWRFYGSA